MTLTQMPLKAKAGKHAKLPWNMVKNFTNFQNFLEEKYQNIHLNDKIPLKIANNISLQKLNFPVMRFPNSAFFPCMIPAHCFHG